MHPLLIVLCVLLAIIGCFFLWMTIAFLTIDKSKKYENDNAHIRLILNICVAVACFVMRIKLHTTGTEKLPKENGMLIISNHRSNFDPILKLKAFRKLNLVMISKTENFKYPWIGRFIHRLRFFAIDRSSIAASRRVFAEASKMMENEKTNMTVYPEGTRSHGENLLPFHSAVFIMAMKSKVPVVVTSISGTETISKNFPFKHTDVQLHVIDVIEPEWIAEHSLQEISDRAEMSIREDLNLPVAA